MRALNALLALVVAVFTFSSFGSDAEPVTLDGSWRAASTDASRNTTTRVQIRRSADGTQATVDAEIRVGGKLRQFSTVGSVDGNAVHYKATLSREGVIGALEDKLEGGVGYKPETIEGDYTLDPARAEVSGRWALTTGESGDDSFFRRGTGWQEKYLGGSPEAEAQLVKDLAQQVNEIQDGVAKGKTLERGFHNKGFGFDARLTVADEIAPELRVGPFQPGASYSALVRFSNAGATYDSDLKPGQRGLAFRVKTGQHRLLTGLNADAQDFLTTNSPVTARDPVQFLAFARAQIEPSRLLSVEKTYGLEETTHIATTLLKGTDIKSSMTKEGLWSSRAPFKWGPFAVKFSLTPASTPKKPLLEGLPSISGNRLETDMEDRLHQGDVVLDMWVQRFESEETTPIEDGSVEWKAPLEKVAQLTIAKLETPSDEAGKAAQEATLKAIQAEIEKQAFNPWNTTEDFRPLGSLNRARKVVYTQSAAHRGGCPLGYVLTGK